MSTFDQVLRRLCPGSDAHMDFCYVSLWLKYLLQCPVWSRPIHPISSSYLFFHNCAHNLELFNLLVSLDYLFFACLPGEEILSILNPYQS
jgi:hypothetical protein